MDHINNNSRVELWAFHSLRNMSRALKVAVGNEAGNDILIPRKGLIAILVTIPHDVKFEDSIRKVLIDNGANIVAISTLEQVDDVCDRLSKKKKEADEVVPVQRFSQR